MGFLHPLAPAQERVCHQKCSWGSFCCCSCGGKTGRGFQFVPIEVRLRLQSHPKARCRQSIRVTVLIVAPWQSSLDLRGPSIRLQTGFRPHLSSGTLLVRPRSADSVNFDPHHRFLSSERSADCCSNTFTAQVLRQVVRRKSESVDSRSPGRGASRPGK